MRLEYKYFLLGYLNAIDDVDADTEDIIQQIRFELEDEIREEEKEG